MIIKSLLEREASLYPSEIKFIRILCKMLPECGAEQNIMLLTCGATLKEKPSKSRMNVICAEGK